MNLNKNSILNQSIVPKKHIVTEINDYFREL